MLAGVEVLLLVVPVWIWMIDWSYCRLYPRMNKQFLKNEPRYSEDSLWVSF
jgi:hypothetical protein